MVALGGVAVSYERGTPVAGGSSFAALRIKEVPRRAKDLLCERELAQRVGQHILLDVQGAVLALVVRQ